MGKLEEIAELAARLAGDAPPPVIRAYHASPFDFDKFDSAHIGKGEGQQAYGPGLYFAQSPAVIEEYYKAFKHFRPTTSGEWSKYTVRNAEDMLKAADGDRSVAIERLEALLPGAVDDLSLRPQIEDAIAYLQNQSPPKRTRYAVQIHHPETSLLDYDLPLAKQNEKVRAVIDEDALFNAAADGGTLGPDFDVNAPVGPILAGHAAAGGRQAAFGLFGALREAGVPGMRYLDGYSRSGAPRPRKTRNYVMFPGSEDAIEIIRKYGWLLPATYAAGEAAGTSPQPQMR